MHVYRSICWGFTLISFLKNDFQRWRKTYCMRTQILSFQSKPKGWYLSIFPSSSLDTLTPSSRHTAYASVGTFLEIGRSSPFLFLRVPKALLSFKALLKNFLLNGHRPSHHLASQNSQSTQSKCFKTSW